MITSLILCGVSLFLGLFLGLWVGKNAAAVAQDQACFFAEQWAQAEAALRNPSCSVCGSATIYQIRPTPERGLVCYCRQHTPFDDDDGDDDDRQSRLLRDPEAWKDGR